MSFKSFFWKAGVGAIGGAQLGAAFGEMSAVVGSAMLSKVDNMDESRKLGAIGGGFFFSVGGFLVGGAANHLSFSLYSPKVGSLIYTASQILSGIFGYGILKAYGDDMEMDLETTAKIFLLGGMMTSLPASPILRYLILPLLAKISTIPDRSDVPSLTRL